MTEVLQLFWRRKEDLLLFLLSLYNHKATGQIIYLRYKLPFALGHNSDDLLLIANGILMSSANEKEHHNDRKEQCN